MVKRGRLVTVHREFPTGTRRLTARQWQYLDMERATLTAPGEAGISKKMVNAESCYVIKRKGKKN